MTILKIKKLNDAAKMPTRGTAGSGCFDLYADADVFLGSGEIKKIPTGLAFEIPAGFCAVIYSRSSAFVNLGLIVGTHVIDADYRGEVSVAVRYDGRFPLYRMIHKGDRIAQFKLERVDNTEIVQVDELSETERGDGGFGSTGK